MLDDSQISLTAEQKYESLKQKIKKERSQKENDWKYTDIPVDKSRAALKKEQQDEQKKKEKNEEKSLKKPAKEISKKIQDLFSETAKKAEKHIKSADDLLTLLKISSHPFQLVRDHLSKIENATDFLEALQKLIPSEVALILRHCGLLQDATHSSSTLKFSIADQLANIALLLEKDQASLEGFLKKNRELITSKDQLEKIFKLSLSSEFALELFKEKAGMLDHASSAISFIAEIDPKLHHACLLFLFEKKPADFFSFSEIADVYDLFLSKNELAQMFEDHQKKFLQDNKKIDLFRLLEILLCQDLPRNLYVAFIKKMVDKFEFDVLKSANFFSYVPEDIAEELYDSLSQTVADEKASIGNDQAKFKKKPDEAYEALKNRHKEERKEEQKDTLAAKISPGSYRTLAEVPRILTVEQLMSMLKFIAPEEKLELASRYNILIKTSEDFKLIFPCLSTVNHKLLFLERHEDKITCWEDLNFIKDVLLRKSQKEDLSLFIQKYPALIKTPMQVSEVINLWVDSFDKPEWVIFFQKLQRTINDFPVMDLPFETFQFWLSKLLQKNAPRSLYMAILQNNIWRVTVEPSISFSLVSNFLKDYVPEDEKANVLMKMGITLLTLSKTDIVPDLLSLIKENVPKDKESRAKYLNKFYEQCLNFTPFSFATFISFLKELPETGAYRLRFAEKYCDKLALADCIEVVSLLPLIHRESFKQRMQQTNKIKMDKTTFFSQVRSVGIISQLFEMTPRMQKQ